MLNFADNSVVSAPPGTLTHEISQQSKLTVHPWFYPAEPPVIVACGDWSHWSSLRSLLQAFAQVRSHKNSRLMILGEVSHRSRVDALLEHHQILPYTAMIGTVSNTANYLNGADVCVFFNHAIDNPVLDLRMQLKASAQYCLLRCIKHAFAVLPSGLSQLDEWDSHLSPQTVASANPPAPVPGQWLITTKAPHHLAQAITTHLDRPHLQHLQHHRLEILEQTGLLETNPHPTEAASGAKPLT
jgi:hypothetical protein